MASERRLVAPAAAILLLAASANGGASQEVVVGGITPSVRPANAPSINAIHYGSEWFSKALRGVSEPYPKTLIFLNNQGEWYTPFTHRGMPGRYDIRGLHRTR